MSGHRTERDKFLKISVGSVAPDFSLESNIGHKVSLSEFRGKKNVVLYFYPKDETMGCTKEACSFRDSYDVFKGLNTEVIGVSSDSPDSHRKFAEHHKLPFILLSDPEKKVRKLYDVRSNMGIIPGRVTYIISRGGIILHIFNSQTRPEEHVREALRILDKERSSE
ncbi:MAG TPA: peroxiredoxin [Candidatus Binatus sp.]|nr:peroxiredoxin [Candidatus Binatus sp.]